MNTIKHSAKSYTRLVLAIHIHIHMVNLNIHTQCQIGSTRPKKERHCVCVCMWAWLCSLYMTAACRTDLVWQITVIGCWFTDGVPLCECAVFVIWRLIHSLCACILAFLHIGFVCIVWFVDGNPVSSSFAIPTCLHCDWAVSNHLMWFGLVKQPMFLWWGPPPWCVLGVFDADSLRALKSTLSRSRCPIKQWQAFFSDRYTCTHSYTHFRPDKYWFCRRSL